MDEQRFNMSMRKFLKDARKRISGHWLIERGSLAGSPPELTFVSDSMTRAEDLLATTGTA